MEWLLIVLAAPFALLLAAVVARMWEKRLVWPYVPADAVTIQATSYTRTTAEEAEGLGFAQLGVFRDGKGRIYRIRYELWGAPRGDVLLLVGGGGIGGIPVDGSWLFTRLSNGGCIASIDNEAGREHDLTGLIHESVYPRRTLEALLASHRQAVAAAGAPAVPYSDPLSDHRELLSRRIRALVNDGYASFCGQSHERWRYTARGAVAATLSSYWRGVSEGLRQKAPASPAQRGGPTSGCN